MTIQEAYERIEAIVPPTVSVTIQIDTWKHYWDKKRGDIETTFLVSWSDGKLFQAKSLEEAVVNAERYMAQDAAPKAQPAEIDTFLTDAAQYTTAEVSK